MSIVISSFRRYLLLLVSMTVAVAGTVEANGLQALRPGEFVVYQQDVPVDLVFIGYDRSQIDEQAIKEVLPATYRPIVRFPQFYGLSGRDVGLEFTFRYTFIYKNTQFENHFFSFLKRAGVEGPITAFQGLYNDQTNNVLDVEGPVLYIDAPKVERYLAGPAADNQRGYTIFFINWYGRKDFRFTSTPRPTSRTPTLNTTSGSSGHHEK